VAVDAAPTIRSTASCRRVERASTSPLLVLMSCSHVFSNLGSAAGAVDCACVKIFWTDACRGLAIAAVPRVHEQLVMTHKLVYALCDELFYVGRAQSFYFACAQTNGYLPRMQGPPSGLGCRKAFDWCTSGDGLHRNDSQHSGFGQPGPSAVCTKSGTPYIVAARMMCETASFIPGSHVPASCLHTRQHRRCCVVASIHPRFTDAFLPSKYETTGAMLSPICRITCPHDKCVPFPTRHLCYFM
jgi:hypothetical protein